MSQGMTPKERIIAARIALLRHFPFFGSLAMHLRPIELTKEEAAKEMMMPTMGVDEYGNMPYNKAFVEKITQDDLIFVIAHEVMHLALEHLGRKGSRDPTVFNIAADEAINLLLKEEMKTPDWCLKHEEFANKSAEEIYDIIIQKIKSQLQAMGLMDKNGKLTQPLDSHYYGSGNQGQKKQQGQGSGNQQKLGSKWAQKGQEKLNMPKVVKDAASFAKSQGRLPAGMERLFKHLLEPKCNWKEILRKYIMNSIPQDWNYMKPSKRSISSGFYMPQTTKEEVNIIVGVDSSGSISDEEYHQFLTEIWAMTKSVANLKATVIVCDAEISEVVEIDNSFDPAFMHGRGYGGTSCLPVFDWIEKEKNNNIKLLVYLTDGYIDTPRETPPFPHLWVITKHGQVTFGVEDKGGQVIKMEEGEDDE